MVVRIRHFVRLPVNRHAQLEVYGLAQRFEYWIVLRVWHDSGGSVTMSIGPAAQTAPGLVLDGLPGEGVMVGSVGMSLGGAVVTAAGPTVNTNGVVEWGVRTVIPLILLAIGITIIAGARKGRMAENANTVTNILIGAAVIGGAGLIFAFATQLVQLLLG
jgi:hypothetical protein